LPGFVASSTFDQRCTGCGDFQRNGPVGDAAYGIPLNVRVWESATPRTNPESIRTTWPPVTSRLDTVCAAVTLEQPSTVASPTANGTIHNLDFMITLWRVVPFGPPKSRRGR
jgi:hypothetical protein